ncbi:hypothetical protein COT12_01520 [Candidatus Berkelbacteria bacterium CG08_land_8_20_14_0_20_39_8]|uniref:Uncharacterized protein n=1 Tax=Candidatus Berkelbacteria bacterium CG08_land_8_20_14_0_20_39_8 TaxID=1974511 RepID=A0A2M6YCA9_9BACT|nr:MAG: hypothetical protein COT12_01520 [Candidatus Berkelbacteria bacterium CG08_land_8_20_14_0_20_39_8]
MNAAIPPTDPIENSVRFGRCRKCVFATEGEVFFINRFGFVNSEIWLNPDVSKLPYFLWALSHSYKHGDEKKFLPIEKRQRKNIFDNVASGYQGLGCYIGNEICGSLSLGHSVTPSELIHLIQNIEPTISVGGRLALISKQSIGVDGTAVVKNRTVGILKPGLVVKISAKIVKIIGPFSIGPERIIPPENFQFKSPADLKEELAQKQPPS